MTKMEGSRGRLAALAFVLLLASTGSLAAKGGFSSVPESSIQKGKKGKRFALVVGVGQFKDPAFQDLLWATKDAEDMAKALDEFDEVVTLTGPDETSYTSVISALAMLQKTATSPSDTVVIYLSTHGMLARKPGETLGRYVVLADSYKSTITKTGLPVTALYETLDAIPSKRKALVFAFCHSGKGKSVLSDGLAKKLAKLKSGFFVEPLEEVSEATAVVSASSWGEPAMEDDTLQNDVYTHYLIEGIATNDVNGDGAVTITEAHDYARDKTYYMSGGQQKPSIELHLEGLDTIVLKGAIASKGKPVIYSYDKVGEGLKLWIDGTKKGVFPGSFALEPGTHEIRLEGDETLYEGSVTVGSGQAMDMETLLPKGTTWGLSLGVGTVGYLDDVMAQGFLSTPPVVSLRVLVKDLLVDHTLVSAHVGWTSDAGNYASAFGSIPYTTTAYLASVGVGGHVGVGPYDAGLTVEGGVLYLARSMGYTYAVTGSDLEGGAEATYANQEEGIGYTAGLTMHHGVTLWSYLDLSMELSGGLLFMDINQQPETLPYLSGTLLMGVSGL